jgi:hypothetical protein
MRYLREEHHRAKCKAEFEAQLARIYAYDNDEVWKHTTASPERKCRLVLPLGWSIAIQPRTRYPF